MFSFFAWVCAITGFCGTGYNLYAYINLYRYDPWDTNNSAYLTNAIIIFFISLVNLLVLRKLAKMEKDIDHLVSRVNSLSAGIGRIHDDCGKSNVDVEKETRRVDEIKQQIDVDRSAKYQQHIKFIENKLFAGKCPKKELLETILAPKEWEENILGSRVTWFAMYQYYDNLLPILLREKAHEDVILAVCEEAYRLIGFLGINLDGENSEIMSYYCDVEKQTYGKSAKLTAMCHKLDVSGVLDRGQPFGNRLK